MERASAAKSGSGPNRSMPIWALASSVPRSLRHADLVRPVVVIGAVVVHHDQHRDFVFRGDPQRAGVEHQVAVGLDVDHDAPLALVRERDAERDADLGRGAELDAGMAVGLVEIPQLAHLLLEVVGGQHPVLVLDHLPDLEREPREGDRRGVPVLARLLLPRSPRPRRGACRSRVLRVGDARRELGVAGDALLADAGELGDAERGVAERPHRARLHAAIVHRPFADVDLAEADLDEIARRRRELLARALGVVELGELLLPIVDVEADDQIGVPERVLVHAQAQRVLVGKIERVVDVPHRRARWSRPARRCSRNRRRGGRHIPPAAVGARP